MNIFDFVSNTYSKLNSSLVEQWHVTSQSHDHVDCKIEEPQIRVAEITQPRFFTSKLPEGAKGLVIYLVIYW